MDRFDQANKTLRKANSLKYKLQNYFTSLKLDLENLIIKSTHNNSGVQ